jgi:hypothetical protein
MIRLDSVFFIVCVIIDQGRCCEQDVLCLSLPMVGDALAETLAIDSFVSRSILYNIASPSG